MVPKSLKEREGGELGRYEPEHQTGVGKDATVAGSFRGNYYRCGPSLVSAGRKIRR